MSQKPRKAKSFKSGFVALCGKPNVGKSTLLNTLFKEKLTIVSPKPQTTRHVIPLILTGKKYQIVFMDTPGLFEPQYLMQKSMVNAAFKTIQECDVIVFMAEPHLPDRATSNILERLKNEGKKSILVINKVDRLKNKNELLPVMDAYSRTGMFEHVLCISALKDEGTESLVKKIAELLPVSPPYYDEEQLTVQQEKFFVQEFIREKIFLHFKEEIPYSAAVLVEKFEENPGRKDHIVAAVYVEKDSQKGILIGNKGSALKRIGAEARKDIEEFLQRPVYLELWVKVKPQWRKNPRDLKELGIDE